MTGCGIGPASTNDRLLAETFFAARAVPQPRLPGVGTPTSDCSLADMGFSGKRCQPRWADADGAVAISPPQCGSKRAWPKPLKRRLAAIREVIEAVKDRCGLDRERPHALVGLQARLAAAIGPDNVRCWLNRQRGRGPLQFADLIDR